MGGEAGKGKGCEGRGLGNSASLLMELGMEKAPQHPMNLGCWKI